MILNRQRRVPLALKSLARFSERVQRELGFPEESVTVCFVSDPAMARMNRKFRDKHGPTDVLSFHVRHSRTRRSSRRRGTRACANLYVGDNVSTHLATRRQSS